MKTALPRGWAWATVDDLARYVNGLAFKPSDWEESGRPIIRIQNLTGKTAFNYTTRPVSQDVVVREGDILVSWSATLDVFVWRGAEAVLNQHIFKVIPASQVRNHVFLRWALKNAIEELWASEHSHGTTMKHVNRGPFLAHSVKLPPAPEQRRIADAIESYFTRLDDAVATLERVQRNLKGYRASVLKAAVEGRLVPTEAELARAEGRSYEPASALLTRILAERRRRWEEAELAKMKSKGKAPKDDKWKTKYVEPVTPETSELPPLPEGWCWASPGQFFSWASGDFLPKKAQHGGPVPVIGGNGVNGFHDEALVLKPTIVVGRVGAHCGNIHLTDGPVWITDNAIYAAEGCDLSVLPYWRMVMSMQNLNANAGGTGQPYVNQKHLDDLAIPLAPEAEQRRVVQEVEKLDSVLSRVDCDTRSSEARLTRLRQSILKWAFEGRLVDQDPTDEPASVLLERIRAERASATDHPPRRARRAKARTPKS